MRRTRAGRTSWVACSRTPAGSTKRPRPTTGRWSWLRRTCRRWCTSERSISSRAGGTKGRRRSARPSPRCRRTRRRTRSSGRPPWSAGISARRSTGWKPLSRAYRGLGQAEKATEHLGKVGTVGVRPDDPVLDSLESLRTGERARLESGKRAYNAGRLAEAAEEFRGALKARPESVEARINLAAALARQGDTGGAITNLREAVKLAPANPTARYNLGLLLAAGGAI